MADLAINKEILIDDEELLEWLEQIDQAGPCMPFEELEEFVFEAPKSVKETNEYQYIMGLYDGRMLHEKMGGICRHQSKK